MSMLILLRNGQSLADARREFDGLLDPELTSTGVEEAHGVADLLVSRHLTVDLAVTSPLARAVQTVDAVLARLRPPQPERRVTWRLAARDLGCLTGVAKPRAIARFGAEALAQWRFSTDGRPPAASPEMLRSSPWVPAADVVANLPFGEGESLRQVEDRVTPLWDELRAELATGRTVLVVAHTDSLRALRRVIEGRAEDEGDTLRVVPAQPLVYQADAAGDVTLPALYLEDEAAG